MIGEFFLKIPYFFLTWLIGVFHVSSGFPEEVHTAANALGGYLGILDPMVPIATLATVIGILFSVEIGIFGFKTLKWLMSHVPGIGGRG